jgi:hypothetical protein
MMMMMIQLEDDDDAAAAKDAASEAKGVVVVDVLKEPLLVSESLMAAKPLPGLAVAVFTEPYVHSIIHIDRACT